MAKSGKGSKANNGRIAENRKARFNYAIEETLEAGIVLSGTEVRSAREGGVNLSDSYVLIQGGEAWLLNCRIAPYAPAARFNHEPLRERKLLLHRRQIDKLDGRSRTEGYALVVLKMYFDPNGRLKAEVAIARGKKLYDKRASAREKDAKREIERAMRSRG